MKAVDGLKSIVYKEIWYVKEFSDINARVYLDWQTVVLKLKNL